MTSPRRLLLLAAAGAAALPAAGQPPAGRPGPPAAVTSADGTVSRKREGYATIDPVPKDGTVGIGDLLIPLPGATLLAAGGAVELVSRADYDGTAPDAGLDTAVGLLAPPPGIDLDVTLDRGRVELVNRKADGPAVVAVRFGPERWVVTLDKPGTRVAVGFARELPAGTPFTAAGPDPAEPPGTARLVVLAGAADVSDGRHAVALAPPPGPAAVSAATPNPAPFAAARLDAAPAWALPAPAGPGAEALRAARAAAPADALDRLLGAADPAARRAGLVAAASFDEPARLLKAWAAATDPAEWDACRRVLRAWVGRRADRPRALYQTLIDAGGCRPAQAETVVQLLLGFAPAARDQPELYEVLIGYLRNDRAEVRDLAGWHLARVAPAGAPPAPRPNGPKADAEPAYRAWKALAPPGQLPRSK